MNKPTVSEVFSDDYRRQRVQWWSKPRSAKNEWDGYRVQDLLFPATYDEPMAFRELVHGQTMADIVLCDTVGVHFRSDIANTRRLYVQEFTLGTNVWSAFVIVLLSIRRRYLYVSNNQIYFRKYTNRLDHAE
ncbi:uncharacterized protein LOC144477940 [Augochlora pura]